MCFNVGQMQVRINEESESKIRKIVEKTRRSIPVEIDLAISQYQFPKFAAAGNSADRRKARRKNYERTNDRISD